MFVAKAESCDLYHFGYLISVQSLVCRYRVCVFMIIIKFDQMDLI